MSGTRRATRPRDPAREPKGKPRLRGPERKQQITHKAKELFLLQGYQATTTKKIAQAAGVTEMVLYRHFAGKKALFLGVVQEARQALFEHWQAELARLTDAQARLYFLAQALFDHTPPWGLDLQFLHRSLIGVDADVAESLRAFYLDCEGLLVQVLTEGQQAGMFRRNLDPRVGAWALLNSALGYSVTQPLAIPLYQEADSVPRAIEAVLHGFLKTDV
jgi:AcrR family transcriptional regulator